MENVIHVRLYELMERDGGGSLNVIIIRRSKGWGVNDSLYGRGKRDGTPRNPGGRQGGQAVVPSRPTKGAGGGTISGLERVDGKIIAGSKKGRTRSEARRAGVHEVPGQGGA